MNGQSLWDYFIFSHYTIISLVVIPVIHLKRLNAFKIKNNSKKKYSQIVQTMSISDSVSNKVIIIIMGPKTTSLRYILTGWCHISGKY